MIVGFSPWSKFHRTPEEFGLRLGINLSSTGAYHPDSKRKLDSLRYFEIRNRIDFLSWFGKSLEHKPHSFEWIRQIDFKVDVEYMSFYVSIVLQEIVSLKIFNDSLNNKLTHEFISENKDDLLRLVEYAIQRYKKYLWKSIKNSMVDIVNVWKVKIFVFAKNTLMICWEFVKIFLPLIKWW